MQKESKFLTELSHSFKLHPNCNFYKIPDAPTADRFSIKRPFDVFLHIGNIPVAIEAKTLSKEGAINYNLLREHQKEALEEFESVPGRYSYVFVNIRQKRDIVDDLEHINDMYIISHSHLREVGSIFKKDLKKYNPVKGKGRLFDVSSFITEVRLLDSL